MTQSPSAMHARPEAERRLRLAYAFDRLLPTTETDAEQALAMMAALARRGAEVVTVLPCRHGREGVTAQELRDYYHVLGDFAIEQIDTRMASFMPWRKLVHALRVVRAPALARADAVYTRNAATLVSAVLHGLPVVYDTHRAWPDHLPFTRPLFRSVMSRPSFVGAVLHSDYARRSYLRLGVDGDKLLVAHNGCDPGRFKAPQSRADARKTLGLSLDRPTVVYTGHMTAFKGIQMVFAMARRCPDVLFLLVGSSGRGCVERQARRHDNVRVLPWQSYDRVSLYLWSADVLLLPPSRVPLTLAGHTVLPLKVYGYLAASRPILAPSTPDLMEVLTHGQNAWLVEADNVDAAVGGLRRLLDDDLLRGRLCNLAKETAETLTWDARAGKIVDFIERRLRVGR